MEEIIYFYFCVEDDVLKQGTHTVKCPKCKKNMTNIGWSERKKHDTNE